MDLFDIKHVTLDQISSKHELLIISESDTWNRDLPNPILRLNRRYSTYKIRALIIEKVTQCKDRQCIVGIDPGVSVGVSIIFCDETFETNVFYQFSKLKVWLENRLKDINFTNLVFKIGNGGGSKKDDYIRHIKQNFTVPILEVDESNTSIREVGELTIHEQAAIKIAYRSGTEV